MEDRALASMLMLLILGACRAATPAQLPAPALPGQIEANAKALFATYDADHDGALAPAEAAKVGLAGAAFTEADTDRDGRLAPAEFLAPARLKALEPAFRMIAADWLQVSDADGDGRLSQAEYQDAMLQPQPGAAAQDRADLRPAAFAAADADHDAALAPAEALGLVGWLLERGWRLAPRG